MDENKTVEPHYDYTEDSKKELLEQLQLRDFEIMNLKKDNESLINKKEKLRTRFNKYVDNHKSDVERWKRLDKLIVDLMKDNQDQQDIIQKQLEMIEDLQKNIKDLEADKELLKEQILANDMGFDSKGNVLVMDKLKELEQQIKEIYESLKEPK